MPFLTDFSYLWATQVALSPLWPQGLKSKIISFSIHHFFSKIFCQIIFFVDPSFEVEMYQPYTNIILSARSARTFYIIRQGIVSVEADNARRGHLYHLEEGDSFGLEAFANINNPRYVT
jgi:signal-transduction protein with cAMP-binding, CBS, and nucleotidyltransferase domain